MKDMRRLFLIGSLLCSFSLSGINDNSQFENARSISLSNATVASYGNLNPASTIFIENSCLVATYENKYITKELSSIIFTGLYKSKFIDLSFSLNYFGYEIYNETSFLISSSKQLSDWLSLGLKIQYTSFFFQSEEGRSNQLSAGIGIILFQNKDINIGLNFGNLLNLNLDNHYKPLSLNPPFNYQLGLAYHPSTELCFLFQLSQWEKQNIQLSVAAEYKGISSFPIRLGLSGMPFSPSFGIGYLCNCFQIDIATKYYLNLGFTPSLSLTYKF